MADGSEMPTMPSFVPSSDTEHAFRETLGKFATGVTVVTCRTDLGPLGITANSFSSLSLDPPLVMWAPARRSRRFDAFAAASDFAIHVLSHEQKDMCRRFSRDGYDFEGLDWSANAAEVPLIHGCLARLQCTQVAVHEGGDHVIVVGQVHEADRRNGEPLVFSSGRLGRFTHAF